MRVCQRFAERNAERAREQRDDYADNGNHAHAEIRFVIDGDLFVLHLLNRSDGELALFGAVLDALLDDALHANRAHGQLFGELVERDLGAVEIGRCRAD